MSLIERIEAPIYGKCRNCEDERDACEDPITYDKLAAPVYKTPQESCYNADTLKTWFERRKTDPMTRMPVTPHPDLVENANRRFEWMTITSLKEAGMDEEASRLFELTLPYATDFISVYIISLKRVGMHEEASKLFERTLQYATRFSVSDIRLLKAEGMDEEASKLFERTLEYAIYSFAFEAELLKDAGMEEEAATYYQRLSPS